MLEINKVHQGLAESLMLELEPNSIALSVWSPPYHVGKGYEDGQSYEKWLEMLKVVIEGHLRALKPGGFMAINISDILVFPDENMPRIQADNVSMRRSAVTREDVLAVLEQHPTYNRRQIAEVLGCSEQTVHRRLLGNNIRGGKYATQTRVKLVGGIIEHLALEAGLFTYDRRIWRKDPAWANCNWTSNSYRSVDEFEYIYIFWKPGPTVVDRNRIGRAEWSEWGSRAIWDIPSVRKNDIHEAMFPVELPLRLIRLLTDEGELVLDPFMGSGTSAVAARMVGRSFIGFEKDPANQPIIESRLAAVQPQLDLGQHG